MIVINNEYDLRLDTADRLLDHYLHLTGWAEGLADAGAQVTVFQRYDRDAEVWRKGVCYRLCTDGHPPKLRSWQVPRRLHGMVREHCRGRLAAGSPTVVHLGGLVYPVQTRHLSAVLPSACALAVQHHAELPRAGLRGYLQAWGLRRVDGFLFTCRELAANWIDRRIIRSQELVYEVMECSSLLAYQDRGAARRLTKMSGSPIVLWTGNLTSNKDPLTILSGFERVLARVPTARLYMVYRRADLLDQVRATIEQRAPLRPTVSLLGEIPYAEIGPYYNSADLFVQGSAKEGSGIAVLDSLACGVVPVVTEIPSFRTILADGAVGALWPVGHADAFAGAMLRVLETPFECQSHAARQLFQSRWTYSAIGREAVRVYQELLRRRAEPARIGPG
ncbi:MAG: glycosyltransferase family 4 protein [Planctomycetota bacterium]|nr:glycosyltransferase family 4 protein [Planctomycetota bacterium]